MMRILLSNDDGCTAPGLSYLAIGLSSFGKITVVAPDRERSGAGNSLTLDRPLRVTYADNGFIHVDGTPVDCVHLAITGLLDHQPDIVVSGINAEANLGDGVLYSGTVAAAMEGRFLDLPSMAISLVSDRKGPVHFETAVRAVRLLFEQIGQDLVPAGTIFNVNVPDLDWRQIRGFEVTRLGYRSTAEKAVVTTDPRGRTVYWVGSQGLECDAGPGTDFFAVKSKKVSVTPIHADLTRYGALEMMSNWVDKICWF
uniref:5'-nucleotidase SurE n=1 Tax=Candidatus Kentrum sp. MB TaxID=2138164 RepID=A0A450XH61_9GAMM|nr:MAG: 5'-nucleotidase /3'-nucleotidase /exopolyphosphatase [Candidatus Kentron sp. MB]VFK32221.1 MAG: 5'-nucleotidase /3'-nucleotidase /exopolyphosphatase [Candidatus Kentron sp. MB]VFK75756.1 MAG: 5'-nucleotidase /3'-nucleotidase /exopolyphosphatase [Candidatus Kentron sp. MB]